MLSKIKHNIKRFFQIAKTLLHFMSHSSSQIIQTLRHIRSWNKDVSQKFPGFKNNQASSISILLSIHSARYLPWKRKTYGIQYTETEVLSSSSILFGPLSSLFIVFFYVLRSAHKEELYLKASPCCDARQILCMHACCCCRHARTHTSANNTYKHLHVCTCIHTCAHVHKH